MESAHSLSLLDVADVEPITWYVCYCDAENPEYWNRYLKKGYQHVQLRSFVKYGPDIDDVMWLVVDPGLAYVRTKIYPGDDMAPWRDPEVLHSQRVTIAKNARKVREWFSLGPVTCVEIAKAYLGINSWRVRTPWQLHNYIRQRGCALR